mgnify:CR=1 FL=1
MTTKIPVIKDKILIIESIVEFFRPEYLKISISLFSNNLIKNNCIVMSNIKGNISNINDGEFRKDKKSVKLIDTFSSLKNSNSVNKFKTKTKLNITKKTKSSDLKKIEEINLIYTLILAYFISEVKFIN